MSTEYIRKSIQDSWRSSFSKKLTRSEAKQASRFRSFLKKEYFKGVDKFVESGSIRSTEDLFPQTQIKSLYIDLYESVGVDFASWYQRNIKKFLAKSAGNKTTWSDKFGQVGEREAARKVVIVQGTAKAQLINVVGRLFKDKDFQDLGRAQQARILKSKFGQISAYQAERIVRTEATNAANQGILQSATDIFGKNMLQKEWVASGDSRTRSFSRGDKAEHLGMDGTVVDYDQRFSVPYSGGIDLMMHPGDPSAHAVNVINCRCSIAVIPKEDAEVNEGLELTGFGGGLAARGTSLIGDQLVAAPKPAPVVDEVVKPKRIVPDELQDKINKGWDLGDISYLDNLADEGVQFRFATKKQANGSYYNSQGKQIVIVLGRRYTKSGKNLKHVVAHEYGHALHHTKGWITDKAKGRGYILDDDYDPDVIKHFKDQNKKIRSKKDTDYFYNLTYPKGGDRHQETLEAYWSNFKKHEDRIIKKYGLTKEEYKRQWESMHDYFGALTKEEIGGGHGYFYYNDRGVNGQMAEIFANAHDFYYNANYVFKDLYPDFYEDAINYMKTMLNKL